MNQEKYLRMNPEELHRSFMPDIMKEPKKAKIVIQEMQKAERYENDFEFRAFVQTGEALIFLLGREPKKAVTLCSDLIERTGALELWQLAAINHNLIGSAYLMLGIHEYALEHYRAAVDTEKERKLSSITSLAYNNIALIFMHRKAYEQVCRYLYLAIEALEREKDPQQLCLAKRLQYLGNLVPALCRSDRLSEVPPLLERIKEIREQEENVLTAGYFYYYGRMFYDFHSADFEEGKAMYHKAKSCIPQEDAGKRFWLICDFLGLCETFDQEVEFYERELLSAQQMQESGLSPADSRLHYFLRKYYRSKGRRDRFEEVNEEYIRLLERDLEAGRKRQTSSLQFVDTLLEDGGGSLGRKKDDPELQRIAEEVLRYKNSVQETYNRFGMINELGKNMTSSLDMEKVVDSIYRNLHENIPLDAFVLMVADPQQGELRSVSYYENDVLQPGFRLDLDNEESLLVECYRTGRLILSDNIYEDPRFWGRRLVNIGRTKGESVVYIPLKFGDETLGVFSVQSFRPNMYKDEHLVFLEVLLPYLSIAINNAMQSWILKREIESHLRTQEKLEAANMKLARLSSVDDLTQISNRRDFELRLLGLVKKAKRDGSEIALLMFDIDNFKLYNDTYGHLEGDLVLKKIARVIYQEMQQVGGLSARFGGEEFIGACSGLDRRQIKELAERIRKNIYDLDIPNEKAPLEKLSISIGVAVAGNLESSDKSLIMRRADVALYEAKNAGKNRVVIKEVRILRSSSGSPNGGPYG